MSLCGKEIAWQYFFFFGGGGGAGFRGGKGRGDFVKSHDWSQNSMIFVIY